MHLNGNILLLTLLAAAMGSAGVCRGQQQGGFELLELKTTLEASARKINDLETQLAAQKAQQAALSQSLASANTQTAQAKESYERLRSLLEGLGITALEGSGDQVRERLIAALSDLKLLNEQKKKLTDSLVSLSEASLAYAKATPSADNNASRRLDETLASVESTVRAASASGAGDESQIDLHQAKVLSIKPEIGVGVLNVGSKDGVRVGMPFSIYREDQPIAKVLVVDVRKSAAGVVVQEILNSKDSIKVGDRGTIDAERSF